MSVLGKVERMEGSAEARLQVAQQRVDGAELGELHAGAATARDGAVMDHAHLRQCSEATQAVGDDGGRQHHGLGSKVLQRFVGERYLRQAAQHRVTEFGRLHGGHERDLVLRATSGLAAHELTAQVRVIDLDAATELPRVFAQPHDFHHLVLEQQRGLVADAQITLELQRRRAVLGAREQMHSQEPDRQCQLGGLKDRPADQAALVPAVHALPVRQPITPEGPAARALAPGADEPPRPARVDHGLLALLLAAVPVEKFRHRQPLLKLNTIHSHGSPPSTVTSSSSLASSLRELLLGHTEVCR